MFQFLICLQFSFFPLRVPGDRSSSLLFLAHTFNARKRDDRAQALHVLSRDASPNDAIPARGSIYGTILRFFFAEDISDYSKVGDLVPRALDTSFSPHASFFLRLELAILLWYLCLYTHSPHATLVPRIPQVQDYVSSSRVCPVQCT